MALVAFRLFFAARISCSGAIRRNDCITYCLHPSTRNGSANSSFQAFSCAISVGKNDETILFPLHLCYVSGKPHRTSISL